MLGRLSSSSRCLPLFHWDTGAPSRSQKGQPTVVSGRRLHRRRDLNQYHLIRERETHNHRDYACALNTQDPEFKARFGYRMSSELAWATEHGPVSKKTSVEQRPCTPCRLRSWFVTLLRDRAIPCSSWI